MHRKCQEISIIVKLSCPFGEIGTIGCFFEVSAHLCTQLGEKQEELDIREHLQGYDLGDQRDIVGCLIQLECCNGWIWNL